MAAKMEVKTIYWSRKPGQFVNLHTGVEVLNSPVAVGAIKEWYNTLADTIFENTTSNQNIMVFSRDIQTILEHTECYRAFLKGIDTVPNHGTWPEEPDKMNLFGFLSNGKDIKEGWVNSDLSEHKIIVFDLNESLATVEIIVKGYPDFF